MTSAASIEVTSISIRFCSRKDEDKSWEIVGAGLLHTDQRMDEVMQKQNCLYTCVTKGSDDTVLPRVIGSMIKYIWAGRD